MKRREALVLIPAASLSAQTFLDRGNYAILEQVCDLLIPSEPGSPGAREARVAWYIDTVIRHAPAATQSAWNNGLRSLGPTVTTAVMDRESANESSFLNTQLKPLAIDAYCLSREGRQALGYKGNGAVGAFPGCTHPEHIE